MKSKKLLLGSLSAMALVATPIAAVVSCDKGNENASTQDTKDTKDTKVVKSDKAGFVFGRMPAIFVTAKQGSKAGSIKVDQYTYTWNAPLKAEKKITSNAEHDKTPSVSKADDKHFVLPMKGKMGSGWYMSRGEVRGDMLGVMLASTLSKHQVLTQLNIPIAVEEKNGKTMATEASVKALNKFIEITGQKVKAGELFEDKGRNFKYFDFTWEPDTFFDMQRVKRAKEDFTDAHITSAVATGAVTEITNPIVITDLASLNAATPNIVFSSRQIWLTHANDVTIKIKSLTGLAASGSVHGTLVLEFSKNSAKETLTLNVVGKA